MRAPPPQLVDALLAEAGAPPFEAASTSAPSPSTAAFSPSPRRFRGSTMVAYLIERGIAETASHARSLLGEMLESGYVVVVALHDESAADFRGSTYAFLPRGGAPGAAALAASPRLASPTSPTSTRDHAAAAERRKRHRSIRAESSAALELVERQPVPSIPPQVSSANALRDAVFAAEGFPHAWTAGWDDVLGGGGDDDGGAARPRRALYHTLPAAALAYHHALRSLVSLDVTAAPSRAQLERSSHVLQALFRKSDAEHARALAAATGFSLAAAQRLTRGGVGGDGGDNDASDAVLDLRDQRRALRRAQAHWLAVAQCASAGTGQMLCFASAYDDAASFERALAVLCAAAAREAAACEQRRGALRQARAAASAPPPLPPASLMSRLCRLGRPPSVDADAAQEERAQEDEAVAAIEADEDEKKDADAAERDAEWAIGGSFCRPRHIISAVVLLRKAALQLEAPRLALPERPPTRSWCQLVGLSIEGDGVDHGELQRGAPFWNADGATHRAHGASCPTPDHGAARSDSLSFRYAVDELIEHCCRHFGCTDVWRALMDCTVLAQNAMGALREGFRSWSAVLDPISTKGAASVAAAHVRCAAHFDRLIQRMTICERLLKGRSSPISVLERELSNDLFALLIGGGKDGALIRAVQQYPLFFASESEELLHSTMVLLIKTIKIDAHVRSDDGDRPSAAECERRAKGILLTAVELSVQTELAQIKTRAMFSNEPTRSASKLGARAPTCGVVEGGIVEWEMPDLFSDAAQRSSTNTSGAARNRNAATTPFADSAFFADDDPRLGGAAEDALAAARSASIAAEDFVGRVQLAMDYAMQPLRGSLSLAVLGVRLALHDDAAAVNGSLVAIARIGDASWIVSDVDTLGDDVRMAAGKAPGYWTPLARQKKRESTATAFPGGVRYATKALTTADAAGAPATATNRLQIAEDFDARGSGIRIEIRRRAGSAGDEGEELGSCNIPTVELLQQRPTRGFWALTLSRAAALSPVDGHGAVDDNTMRRALEQPACHTVLLQFHFTPFQRVVITLDIPSYPLGSISSSVFDRIEKMPSVKWRAYSSRPLSAALSCVSFAAMSHRQQEHREQPRLDEDYVAIFPVASSYACPTSLEAMDAISFVLLADLGVEEGIAWPADNGGHPVFDAKTQTWSVEWRKQSTPVAAGQYEIRCFRRRVGRASETYELIARSVPFEVRSELPLVDLTRDVRRDQQSTLRLYSAVFGMLRDSLSRDDQLLRSIAGYKRRGGQKERREPRFDIRDTLHPVTFLAGAGRMWDDVASGGSALLTPGNPLVLRKCDDAAAAPTWLYFHTDMPIFVHDVTVSTPNACNLGLEVASAKNMDTVEGWPGTEIHAANLRFDRIEPVLGKSKAKFLVNRTARYFRLSVLSSGDDEIRIERIEFRTLLHEFVGSIKRRACACLIKSSLAAISEYVAKRYDYTAPQAPRADDVDVCDFISTLNDMRLEDRDLFDAADLECFSELLPFWVMETFAEKSDVLHDALTNCQLYSAEDCEALMTSEIRLKQLRRFDFGAGLAGVTAQRSAAASSWAERINEAAYEFCILPGADSVEQIEYFANTVVCGLLKVALQETALFGRRTLDSTRELSEADRFATSIVQVRLGCVCLNDLNALLAQLYPTLCSMLSRAPDGVRSASTPFYENCFSHLVDDIKGAAKATHAPPDVSDGGAHELKTLSLCVEVAEGVDLRPKKTSDGIKEAWKPAVVTGVSSDGAIDVEFSNRTVRRRILRSSVRPLKGNASTVLALAVGDAIAALHTATSTSTDPYARIRIVGVAGQRTRFPLRAPSLPSILEEKTECCWNTTTPMWAHQPASILTFGGAPSTLMNPIHVSVLDRPQFEGVEAPVIGTATIPVNEIMTEALWSQLAVLRIVRDSRRRVLLGDVSQEKHALKVASTKVLVHAPIAPASDPASAAPAVERTPDAAVTSAGEEWDSTRILRDYLDEGILSRAEFNALASKLARFREVIEPFEANTLRVVVLDARNMPPMNRSVAAVEAADAYCKLSIQYSDGSLLPRAVRAETLKTSVISKSIHPAWCESFSWDLCEATHGAPDKTLVLDIEVKHSGGTWGGKSAVGRVRIPLDDERLVHGKTSVFSLLAECPAQGHVERPVFNLARGVGRGIDCPATPITRDGTMLVRAVKAGDFAAAKRLISQGRCSEYDRVVAADAAVAEGYPEFEGIIFGCTFDVAVCWGQVPVVDDDSGGKRTKWQLPEVGDALKTFSLAQRGLVTLHHTYDLRAKVSYSLDTVGKYLGDFVKREREQLATKLISHVCSKIDAQLARAMFGARGNVNLFADDWDESIAAARSLNEAVRGKVRARGAELMGTAELYIRMLSASLYKSGSTGLILQVWQELCRFAQHKLAKWHLQDVVRLVTFETHSDATTTPLLPRRGRAAASQQKPWSFSIHDGAVIEIIFENLLQLFRRNIPGHDEELWVAAEPMFHVLQLWKVSTAELKELVCTMLGVDVGADGTDCHNMDGVLVVDSTERSQRLRFGMRDVLAVLWLRAHISDDAPGGAELRSWVQRADAIEANASFGTQHPSEAFPALATRLAHDIAELMARVHG